MWPSHTWRESLITISQMPPGWMATEWLDARSRLRVERLASRTPMSNSSSRITGTRKQTDAPAKRALSSVSPGSPKPQSLRNLKAPKPSIASGKTPCGPTAATSPRCSACSPASSSNFTANVSPHTSPINRQTAAAIRAAHLRTADERGGERWELLSLVRAREK